MNGEVISTEGIFAYISNWLALGKNQQILDLLHGLDPDCLRDFYNDVSNARDLAAQAINQRGGMS